MKRMAIWISNEQKAEKKRKEKVKENKHKNCTYML
jgi:hypothetical protein